VIQKYEVKVNLRAMGMPLSAINDVKLSPNTTAVKFEAELQKISGILEATLMTGALTTCCASRAAIRSRWCG
jgi:DNA-binding Lrp family transcriptional regulator